MKKTVNGDALSHLMALPLAVRAQVLARGLWAGIQATKRRGPGGTFRELREYRPGDPLRFVDWRASARSDRWLVREVDRITQLRLAICVDSSASMQYGRAAWQKLAVAQTLAAAVSLHAVRQGHAIALWQNSTASPPKSGSAAAALFLRQLEQQATPSSPVRLPPLEQAALRVDLLLVIGDFLDADSEQLWRELGLLATRRIAVRVLQILHPDEWEFPFRLPQLFVALDADRQREWQLEPRSVRQRYLQNLRGYIETLSAAARREKLDYRLHLSSASLLPAANFLANGHMQ